MRTACAPVTLRAGGFGHLAGSTPIRPVLRAPLWDLYSSAARDYQMLRTHSDVAPVTKQSGKRRQVVMRQDSNRACVMPSFIWRATRSNAMPRSAGFTTPSRRRG